MSTPISSITRKTVWREGISMPKYRKLFHYVTTDVCIIGGGLTGVTAAYLLAKAGKSVVLIEKKRLGGGATHDTTAFITEIIDTDLADLTRMLGKKKAAEVIRSHHDAIDRTQRIVRAEKIDCEFIRVPNIIYANPNTKEAEHIEDEHRAGTALGIDMEVGTERFPFNHGKFLRVANQAKFHPLRYLYALADAAEKNGAELHEESEATGYSVEDDTIRIEASGGSIEAKQLIIATYEPFNKPLSLYFKKAFYDSYVLEWKAPQGALPEGIFEDMHNPYRYFRVDKMNGYDRLIIGGEDHRSDMKVSNNECWTRLRDYTEEAFYGIPLEAVRRWKGPILEPVDGLAFIGTWSDERIYVAMGFSGNGMTYANIAAHMFTEDILGRSMPHKTLYDPRHIPSFKSLLIKGRDYSEEFYFGTIQQALRRK